ncbi:hypothetical protein [uncultured Campylobacter sp.]|uniref:hypothetical protein n=1 Tax=uncultured Campylobacter sp. TaxID=218934 RepID=UPI00262A5BB7|nr:hypothetical protein [uncultured Campylobacter sp.]
MNYSEIILFQIPLADNNIKSIDLNYKEITIDENSNTVKQSSKVALIDELIYEWAE